MRLCSEYGSAYKTVTDPASIRHLLDAGWHEVEDTPIVEEAQPPMDAPAVTCIYSEPLKYKGLYLSWYVQSGSLKQLREVLTYLGVSYPTRAVKKDLQGILKKHIRETKEALKGETSVDRV